MRPTDPDAPLYNTAAVVHRTGIPAATFRAWERRYGFPKPERTTGGQRLYSERDVASISWLAQQTARGIVVSRAVDMLQNGLAPLDLGSTSPAETPPTGPRSPANIGAELVESLLSFAADRSEMLLSEAFALFSLEDVCTQIIEPVLVEIGDRWHNGQATVAEEHYASSFLRTRLFGLLRGYQRDDAATVVLTACAPGEMHEIGILILSVLLARDGYGVRYLGANLPVDSLKTVLEREQPALVLYSAHNLETASELKEVAGLLESLPRPHPLFGFGGQAFLLDPALKESLAGIYVGPDAVSARDAIRTLVQPRFTSR